MGHFRVKGELLTVASLGFDLLLIGLTILETAVAQAILLMTGSV